MNHCHRVIKTPVGELTLVADPSHLLAILWENDREGRVILDPGIRHNKNPILDETQKQLHEYFDGERKNFDLPVKFTGTEFQKIVWNALRQIPHGQTLSYAGLAKKIGNPNASRAVGAANGRNPISIVVPCHRVIGANGKLTGFAGGLPTKEFLLNLETA